MRKISFYIILLILICLWYFAPHDSTRLQYLLLGSVIIIGFGIWQEVIGIRDVIDSYNDNKEDKEDNDPPSQYPYNHT